MRRNERRIYACLTLLLVVLHGCNITYKVRNQYQEIEEIVHLPCGKITCELVGRGNSRFKFKQQFDIDGTAIIHTDSLRIYFNNSKVEVRHHGQYRSSGAATVEVSADGVWEASFEFEKGVFDGDTIKIVGPKYVHCGGESVTLDTMVYTFINSLRIHGVNN